MCGGMKGYLQRKAQKTVIRDRRDVIPNCIVMVNTNTLFLYYMYMYRKDEYATLLMMGTIGITCLLLMQHFD